MEANEKVIIEAIQKLSIELKEGQKKIEIELKEGQKKIEQEVIDIKIGQAEMKAEVKGVKDEIKGLENRMTSLENRINTQGNWFVTILAILITGILTILGRVVFFGKNF